MTSGRPQTGQDMDGMITNKFTIVQERDLDYRLH